MRLQITYSNGVSQQFEVIEHHFYLEMKNDPKRQKELKNMMENCVTTESPIYKSLGTDVLLGPDNKTWYDVKTKLI